MILFRRQLMRIEEEDEVWDVGAHCGLFLWAMVQEAVGDFRYVGFEPVERSRGALRENVKTLLGNGGNWTIYGVAVGKDAGEAEMTHYPRMPGNSALEGHVGERREARATAMKPETARRLEERAEAVASAEIEALKARAEGAELRLEQAAAEMAAVREAGEREALALQAALSSEASCSAEEWGELQRQIAVERRVNAKLQAEQGELQPLSPNPEP